MPDPVRPSSPPPDYDLVISGKEKPPSYESRTARPSENEDAEPISTQPTREVSRESISQSENDLCCEKYYDPQKTNPFLCIFCWLLCFPLTACVHTYRFVCWSCCQPNSGTEGRRNYEGTYDNNYVYTNNDTAAATGGYIGNDDCGGQKDGGSGDCSGGGETGGGGYCGGGGETGGSGDCGGGGDTGGGGDCGGGGDTGGGGDCGGGSCD